MNEMIGTALLVTIDLPYCNRWRESEETDEPTAPSPPHDDPLTRLSPLGALYRREYTRLSRQIPALDSTTCDRLIILSFARLFLDADATELAQAMIDGSPRLLERTGGHASTYVLSLVRMALDVARKHEARQ